MQSKVVEYNLEYNMPTVEAAVTRCLSDNSMRGIVRAYVGGERWFNRKREILSMCKALEDYERRTANNEGVTVVILK